MSPETVDDKIVRTMKVKCEFVIEIEVPEPYQDEDYNPFFDIEENHCPGTGIVGGALDRHIEKHEAASTCWACALQGKNTILEINGKPVKPRPPAPDPTEPLPANAWAEPSADRYRLRHQLTDAEVAKAFDTTPLTLADIASRAALEARKNHGPVDPNIMAEVLKHTTPRELLADVAFTFEPKLTREKWHRLLGHLKKWCIEEIDVHLMSFESRTDRIDP